MIPRQQRQSPATQSEDRRANGPGFYNGTLYLARRELRRTWRSYIWALGIAPPMGVAAAFMLGANPVQGAGSGPQISPTALNIVFILLIAVLPRTSNWHAGESGSAGWSGPPGGHISFLRSLPLTARQISAARALVSIASVLTLCAAFFAPLYVISGPLREGLGAVGCLLFAAFWVGCALAFEAIGIFTELVFPGFAGAFVYIVLISALAGGVTGGLVGADATVVSAVAGLTRDYGATPALVALGLGYGALALSWLATARRIRKKETRD